GRVRRVISCGRWSVIRGSRRRSVVLRNWRRGIVRGRARGAVIARSGRRRVIRASVTCKGWALTVIARRLRNCGCDRDRQGYHGDRGGDDGIGETPDQAPTVVAAVVPPPCESRRDWGDGERDSEKTGDHE